MGSSSATAPKGIPPERRRGHFVWVSAKAPLLTLAQKPIDQVLSLRERDSAAVFGFAIIIPNHNYLASGVGSQVEAIDLVQKKRLRHSLGPPKMSGAPRRAGRLGRREDHK